MFNIPAPNLCFAQNSLAVSHAVNFPWLKQTLDFENSRKLFSGHLGHSPGSVSYTHLDVYKRQPVYKDTMLYRAEGSSFGAFLKVSPKSVKGAVVMTKNTGLKHKCGTCLLYTSRCV